MKANGRKMVLIYKLIKFTPQRLRGSLSLSLFLSLSLSRSLSLTNIYIYIYIYQPDKVKRDFFQAVTISLLLYECTT